MNKKIHKYINLLVIGIFLISSGCKSKKEMDPNRPLGAEGKRKQNIEEGRGASVGSILGGIRGATTYEFSSSNPMWRASLEVLDFIPLTTVDYSGGMIITDWYSDTSDNNDESLKISVRFLSNEIRSDSLKIVIHKKNCKTSINCGISLLPNNSKLNSELLSVILRKASLLQEADKKNPKKK